MAFHRPIVISSSALRALWLDQSLTIADIASQTGMSIPSVGRLARASGFPARRMGRTPFAPDQAFSDMWRARVCTRSMARHYGVALSTIWATATRLRLPKRKTGTRPEMTVLQFRMRETARSEEAQLRLAEMVDAPRYAPRVAA